MNEAEFVLSLTNSHLASIENGPMVFKPFSCDQPDDNKFLLSKVDLDPDINYCSSIPFPDS